MRDNRIDDRPPAIGVILQTQQIQQQVQVQAADLRVGDAGQPGREALGRVIAHVFDVDGQRTRRRQFASVLGRHEVLIPYDSSISEARCHKFWNVVSLSERRVGDFRFGQRDQRLATVFFGHQGLKGLCQPGRRAAFCDDRRGDEGGDGGIAHAIDHFTDDVHLRA